MKQLFNKKLEIKMDHFLLKNILKENIQVKEDLLNDINLFNKSQKKMLLQKLFLNKF